MALNDYWWVALLFMRLPLFPQPTRTRPSVEYVPLPYTRPEKP